ncbi:hypothetical protein K7432_009839 [Basidiobolus ranarum]|uniref:Phospholipase/carboxylesterase/thioesterase domain-containing protein n=1 Tax=Basidiobolus ranarum TaxID=34480 RepID=A0ABR2WPK3_9FUNG
MQTLVTDGHLCKICVGCKIAFFTQWSRKSNSRKSTKLIIKSRVHSTNIVTMQLHPVENQSNPLPLKKRAPKFKGLTFQYSPSPDGVDENLLIFFHGLGDTEKPFFQLGQSLKLPQTAIISIKAPHAIPYFDEGTQWYPSFDPLGDLLTKDSPLRLPGLIQTRTILKKFFLEELVGVCGYDLHKMILFGFSQGATTALDLVVHGGVNVNSVVSIAGYLLEETERASIEVGFVQNTNVLIIQGDKDETIPLRVSQERTKYVQSKFGKSHVKAHMVTRKNHAMPTGPGEWRPIMEFFAQNLSRRQVELENVSELYEVK